MNEYNICGVLLISNPDKGNSIENTLNKIDGVEVHAREHGGKIVVTVEGEQSRNVAETISSFSDIDGVVSTSLVYHEIDSDQTPLAHTQPNNNNSPSEERL